MNTAEILIGKMQGDRGFKILQFARESICEPSQTPKLRSHGQVLPFNKAGRDVLRTGNTAADFGYVLHDWNWEVPSLPCCPLAPYNFS